VGVDGAAGVFCCGLRMISVDGCPVNVPDTPANNEFFGGPGKGARSGAFPQVRWLAAAESGIGALIRATFGPYPVREQLLARDLLTALGPGMLVLAAGFP